MNGNWFDRLERRFGRYAVPNLTSILVGGQIVVYAIALFVNRNIASSLALYRPAILSGQVWRLVSFLFVPFGGSDLLSFALTAYFTWFIGSALEREWGDFRYGMFLLLQTLGAILACFVTGWADTYCLSLSLLLAFAALYPEMQVLLFFVLPIRVKYIGIVAGVLWLYSFLTAGWSLRLNYLCCMLGFWVFFGPVLYRSLRAWYRREQWKRNNRRW
ncbi:MAG: Rhomboid family protein [Candidatus Faecalibacterium intestinavium]|uniref:Rhomboid family protein n=1 Tax=Candidatus Faecalibacterium intestinavium TaxID=2838580 RepID=A0A9E2KK16_9FIRM|nr:Rhomboid family protein [Candidatus Faecalibacterium intestinavium]